MAPFLFRLPIAKYIRDGIPGSFFIGQLVGEVSAPVRSSTFPGGPVFCVEEVVVGLVPILPAKRMDVSTQVTVQKYCFCKFAPWSAEINRAGRAITGEAAIMENITEGNLFKGGGGSDIAKAQFLAGSGLQGSVLRTLGK